MWRDALTVAAQDGQRGLLGADRLSAPLHRLGHVLREAAADVLRGVRGAGRDGVARGVPDGLVQQRGWRVVERSELACLLETCGTCLLEMCGTCLRRVEQRGQQSIQRRKLIHSRVVRERRSPASTLLYWLAAQRTCHQPTTSTTASRMSTV